LHEVGTGWDVFEAPYWVAKIGAVDYHGFSCSDTFNVPTEEWHTSITDLEPRFGVCGSGYDHEYAPSDLLGAHSTGECDLEPWPLCPGWRHARQQNDGTEYEKVGGNAK
jgi:hypothetical protein